MDLPLALQDYENKYENFHYKEVRQTKNKVRELVISDIQDTLHNPNQKNFHVTEDVAYIDRHRLIKCERNTVLSW